MEKLTGFQRSFLRSLANPMSPQVVIGKGGLSDQVVGAINEALDTHELIKIRFAEFKQEKKMLTAEIEERCNCECVGAIGHVAILFRRQADVQKRHIQLPQSRNS